MVYLRLKKTKNDDKNDGYLTSLFKICDLLFTISVFFQVQGSFTGQ